MQVDIREIGCKCMEYILTWHLKGGIVEPEEMNVARQQLDKHYQFFELLSPCFNQMPAILDSKIKFSFKTRSWFRVSQVIWSWK
jgi:hypothetical protein